MMSICPICQSQANQPELEKSPYTLVRCTNCTLVFATPYEVPADLYDNAYQDEGAYAEYVAQMSTSAGLHLTWGMRSFFKAVKQNGTLLDVGCATGKFMLLAQQRGWQVEGIEISERAAQIAKTRTNAPVTIGTLDQFSTDKQYDAITMWEVLEHLPNPVQTVEKVLSLLKPRGYFAGSVPNWCSLWMRKSEDAAHWPPFHLTYWEPSSLHYLLSNHGFSNIIIRQKPLAWTEELGSKKYALLPISVIKSLFFNQKGIHLFFIAQKV